VARAGNPVDLGTRCTRAPLLEDDLLATSWLLDDLPRRDPGLERSF
jgi:hypothetical protein